MIKNYFKFCPRCGTHLVKKREQAEDQVLPVCPKCGFAFYDNPVTATDSVIIKENPILFIHRNREPRKGFFDFPGGFIDGFEDPRAAAIREVREETGLRFKPRLLIGAYMNKQYDWKGRHIPVIALAYLGTASGQLKLNDEVIHPTWMSYDKKVRMAFSYQEQVLRDARLLIKSL